MTRTIGFLDWIRIPWACGVSIIRLRFEFPVVFRHDWVHLLFNGGFDSVEACGSTCRHSVNVFRFDWIGLEGVLDVLVDLEVWLPSEEYTELLLVRRGIWRDGLCGLPSLAGKKRKMGIRSRW